jgi:uncharacterized protein
MSGAGPPQGARPPGEGRRAAPNGGDQTSGAGPPQGANRGSGAEHADRVPSPCISVCVLDADGALCLGCFRTLDEIASWSLLDADAKRSVLAALPERRSAHGRR